MVYINLFEPVKGFGMIRIKEFHFFDTDDFESVPPTISFKYQLCFKNGDKYEELYTKHVSVSQEEDFLTYEKLDKKMSSNLSAYEEVCRVLLEYLIEKKIEAGTIEVVR